MGILLGVDDPGRLWLDFILPICSSPLDHLSVHCCHHQGKHGWAELRKKVKSSNHSIWLVASYCGQAGVKEDRNEKDEVE